MAKAIKANEDYIGKPVTRLDGKRYKITDTTAKGYLFADKFPRALRAVYVEKQGSKLVELLDHPDANWGSLPNPDAALFDIEKASPKKKKPGSRTANKRPASTNKRPARASKKDKPDDTIKLRGVPKQIGTLNKAIGNILYKSVLGVVTEHVGKIDSNVFLEDSQVLLSKSDNGIQISLNIKAVGEDTEEQEESPKRVSRRSSSAKKSSVDADEGFEEDGATLTKSEKAYSTALAKHDLAFADYVEGTAIVYKSTPAEIVRYNATKKRVRIKPTEKGALKKTTEITITALAKAERLYSISDFVLDNGLPEEYELGTALIAKKSGKDYLLVGVVDSSAVLIEQLDSNSDKQRQITARTLLNSFDIATIDDYEEEEEQEEDYDFDDI